MAAQKYCQVIVSWTVDDGRPVEDVVIYNIESDFEEGQIPSSSLDSLTDLFLSPPVTDSGDPGPPCTAHVSVRDSNPGFAVAAVDVLSSARNVEVFSSTGEYLVLAEGTRLDVAGERKLFLSQHTFDQPQATCDLKFVSLVDSQTLWLHSLHLTLTVDKTCPAFPLAMGPSIDMDKVNAIISDMDADVPEQAKGLMSTMTSIQKNKERAMGNIFGGSGGKGPPTMASIMGMFASMGVTSRMSPATPTPTAPAKPQPNPNQPTQGKVETDQNPAPKTKRHHKSGKKKNGAAAGKAGVEVEESAPTSKQEKQKQNQPKNRPNSGDQSSQQRGKKQKDNNKKDSDDSPRNESSNKKKSGSNSNNKISASNSNNTNSGSESSRKNSATDSSKKTTGSESTKKNSGSDSGKKNSGSESSKKNSASTKEAKSEQQAAKETNRSDSVDEQSPVTQADLFALEQRLLQRIDNAEEAIVAELTSRIEASEQRIVQHMESLVSKMATAFFGGGNMMNGSGRMDEDLTPD